MRDLLGRLVVLACLAAFSGCGTVGNMCDQTREPTVYGGLEIDCHVMKSNWSNAVPEEGKPPRVDVVCQTLVGAALIALDFPLSFVADTLTLPCVLRGDRWMIP